MNFLFWGTPIVYTLEVIPERLSSLILMLNPIAMVIEYHHTIFIHDVKPNIELLLTPFILGTVFCLFGFWLFMKLAGDIVDEL
jgi:lipopolysaccharide transport system permease protein